jgi:hypothetical protein
VKSVYYIAYNTICHFVVLFSDICISAQESINRMSYIYVINIEMGKKEKYM